MKKLLTALLLVFGIANYANASPTTVGDFRGTVQTTTSTGSITFALGADTTIVRINASSEVHFVGMDSGVDGRVVLFWNVGTAHAYFWQEHTSATAANRFMVDANTGSRALYANGQGIGIATYDGTTQRWRFATLEGYNTTGPININGSSTIYGSLDMTNGSFNGTSATLADVASNTRLTLKSLTSGNNGSNVKWKNSAGTSLFTMGPDYYANGGLDFWLYDTYNSVNNLYIKNTGTSYLSFGTSAGGMQYDETIDELGLFAYGQIRMRIGGYQGTIIKLNAPLFFRREASGTPKPTLYTNCNGSGTATWASNDSNDMRGAITLGTGASACTMDYAQPWDATVDNTNQGTAICTASTSTSGRSIAITSSTDHTVTFTPSASGSTTIYYHCDGIAPPTL